MKAKDLKELPTEELIKNREDARVELFNLRFRKATAPIENPMRLNHLKKDIARIETILREKS